MHHRCMPQIVHEILRISYGKKVYSIGPWWTGVVPVDDDVL